MDKHELPSDSDASDEDYIPNGAEAELLSEEESDGVDDEVSENVPVNKKRKSRTKKNSKKSKIENNVETEESASDKKFVEMSEDEKRKHEESLWASFLGNEKVSDKSTTETKDSRPKSNGNTVPNEKIKKPEPKPVTILEFAGEEVRVDETIKDQPGDTRLLNTSASTSSNNERSVPIPSIPAGRGKRGLGMSSVLSQIGKKTKISTLEKSKLDWDRFKNKEGLNEEISNHNKGKDGYLERQDFLQRTDLRQFEIEKQLRTVTRKSNK